MAFSPKTWLDRLSEFPNRRKLDNTGVTDTYDVMRDEGIVSVEGDKINASNMNGLEGRIKTAIDAVESTASAAVQSATLGSAAVTKKDGVLQFPAYPVIPSSLPANGGNANYANTAGSAPANGGTATYAHYSSHAIGSTSGFAVRSSMASTGAATGGQDGDTFDTYV